MANLLTLGFTASRLQIACYLCGAALFSISFLVFLNSSVSFVITDRIKQRHNVGDAVGTLGFADELVALVACPLWGVVSDRVGVRTVTVVGFSLVGLSLFVFVQAKNVYPQLLLARLLFSIGGAATTTMVTAILPTMTHITFPGSNLRIRQSNGYSHNVTPSISSELTITPARYRSSSPTRNSTPPKSSKASTSQIAGLVGMFTGLGALLALLVFLPLPAQFQKYGNYSPSAAIAASFYAVGTVAFAIAIFCFIGLQKLPGEGHKTWKKLITAAPDKYLEVPTSSQPSLSYGRLILEAVSLGFQDIRIGLGYLAGFVARASSVAISLFIPLFVNSYFFSSGICRQDPEDDASFKGSCRRAYILAATLTGTSQLLALICAPLFGWLSARYERFNIPLLVAAAAGMAGYASFGLLQSPDPQSDDGSGGVFLIVALLGISQIGAIVCSLGLLSHGIQNASYPPLSYHANGIDRANGDFNHTSSSTPLHFVSQALLNETSPLMPSHIRSIEMPVGASSRAHLKGSIAGCYSLYGGAGILLLTKLGGWMFDNLDRGAPFFLMAAFNAVLFVVGLSCAFAEMAKTRENEENI
ncbi:hypothetical protein M501DRAFT_936761 [Patellaria atrata CBS 101060]|uniref:MFS transporter n=1 Tax=Patellaria atrata CBS 101060 TaxID=1346257 RepID=A0A9P4VRX8_9PEZI|nr:hypothetical protein M501DRAFT_936761 [Patellaria atrata CBS 101060]